MAKIQPIRRPGFIAWFCSFHQKDIVFTRTKNGTYSKFEFDQSTNSFKAISCPDCRLGAAEIDLFPYYATWSNRLERYVIFVRNSVNGQVEQYVYDKEYEGFQQVLQPELIFDETRSETSNEFFTVGGTEEEGLTKIMRAPLGHFRKEQMDWATKQLVVIPPKPVKILPITELNKNKENSNKNENPTSSEVSRKRKTEGSGSPEQKKEVRMENREVEQPAEEPNVSQNFVQRNAAMIGEKIEFVKPRVLPKKDVVEIRRLAKLMGNRAPEEASSDDADYSNSDGDVAEEEDEKFEVVESSC